MPLYDTRFQAHFVPELRDDLKPLLQSAAREPQRRSAADRRYTGRDHSDGLRMLAVHEVIRGARFTRLRA